MPCLTPEAVNEAFIANIPLMMQTIKDMTIQAPNWFRDLYTPQPWPEGEGTSMQQFKFRGELPQVEEGFDTWALVDDPSGCGTVCAPNCAYNMHVMGGHAFEGKITRLMRKDLRTPDYCVLNIQNTRQFKEVWQAKVRNLYNQIDFHKEVNIGQNFMSLISKKLMIDGAGFKPNPADPYKYRPKGTAVLSALTVQALRRLHEVIHRMVDAVPFAYTNGMPMYALVASAELLSGLWTDDPTFRADIRAVGGEYAKGLIEKYNFTESIMGMFLPVSYMYPRRFRYDSDLADWVRVLPFVKGVPGIVGTFADMNPRYDDPSYATHEEVLVHGKDPFSAFYMPMLKTLGEGSDFGAGEPSGFWDVLKWVNPQTREDPDRREGFYFTTATIGLSADNSEACFGILVPRRPTSTMIAYYPAGPCPPEAAACTNVVPDVGCPTSMIVSLTAHPLTAGTYFVVFAAPVDAEEDDVIQLGHSNGGYVNATVVAVDSTSKIFEVTISGTLPECDRWVSVYTGATLGCSAKVLDYKVNASDSTRLDLILDRPIKADTASDVVVLTYGTGTQVTNATVISVNMLTNKWVVDIGASAFVDQVGGVATICVPTATDSSCPACDGALTSSAQCSED